MILTLRDLLALTAAGCLLALSFATVYYSRKNRRPKPSAEGFLFEGLGRFASLASNTGAVFSVTYFFGATFIYAAIFKGWIRVATVAVLVGVLVLALVVTRRIYDAGALGVPATGNPLLLFLQQRLKEAYFQDVIKIYSVIYFALLIEELAVSRLVLYALMPHPIVVGVLLIVILFVVYTYLYLGGFGAVLAADTVQTTVLIVFAAILLLIVFTRGSPISFLIGPFNRQDAAMAANIFGCVLFGISWFVAAVDFYARLNFNAVAGRNSRVYREFVVVSCMATFALLSVGVIFGDFLSRQLTITSPSTYAVEAVAFFLGEPLVVALVFVVAVFAMIFTTIDTLLVLNLQVGHYQRKRLFRRGTLLHILLAAVVVSTRMSFDSVSAIGIFIGSLMFLPLLVILRSVWPDTLRWLPENPRYLIWALIIAAAGFAIVYPRVVVRFDRHFYLTLLVVAAASISAAASWVAEGIRYVYGRTRRSV